MVYEAIGVRITSTPTIHVLDGTVSYRLDWNGVSFVFGGDSSEAQWPGQLLGVHQFGQVDGLHPASAAT